MIEKPKTVFYMPDDFPQSAMVDIFVHHAEALFRAYPQDKQLPAISTRVSIMHKQFPCPPQYRTGPVVWSVIVWPFYVVMKGWLIFAQKIGMA